MSDITHTHKLTADDINALPLISYDGPIELIKDSRTAVLAAKSLLQEKLLGFDTETRPSFKKGISYPPSILQLAGKKTVFVFQLLKTGMPQELLDILEKPTIIKVGVAINRDIKELKQLEEFNHQGFVDLGDMAKSTGIQHHGLRGLAAVLLQCRISKGARLTNWAMPNLPQAAIRYAATDAWIGRSIYKAIQSIRRKQSVLEMQAIT